MEHSIVPSDRRLVHVELSLGSISGYLFVFLGHAGLFDDLARARSRAKARHPKFSRKLCHLLFLKKSKSQCRLES